MIFFYVGENDEFECQMFSGELEVDFIFQGFLVVCCQVGGVGVFVFFMFVGYGMEVVEGKEVCYFNGKLYILEQVLIVEFVIVKVWKGDCFGNLVYKGMVCNFNLVMVMVGKIIIVEVEELVEFGELDFNFIYMLGVFVQWIFQGFIYEKCIE